MVKYGWQHYIQGERFSLKCIEFNHIQKTWHFILPSHRNTYFAIIITAFFSFDIVLETGAAHRAFVYNSCYFHNECRSLHPHSVQYVISWSTEITPLVLSKNRAYKWTASQDSSLVLTGTMFPLSVSHVMRLQVWCFTLAVLSKQLLIRHNMYMHTLQDCY